MHWIQKRIIKKLCYAPVLRYSELKPSDVDGNLFSYHLKNLQSDKLIEKCDNGYKLTGRGKRLADSLSLETLRPRTQPKIMTMIVCRDARGRELLTMRRRQPFTGLLTYPSGKLHLGETVDEAAHRELSEKADVSAKLAHRGDAYVIVKQGEETISHMLIHAFKATGLRGVVPEEKERRVFWAFPDEARTAVPWLEDIRRLMDGKPGFFAQLSYNVA